MRPTRSILLATVLLGALTAEARAQNVTAPDYFCTTATNYYCLRLRYLGSDPLASALELYNPLTTTTARLAYIHSVNGGPLLVVNESTSDSASITGRFFNQGLGKGIQVFGSTIAGEFTGAGTAVYGNSQLNDAGQFVANQFNTSGVYTLNTKTGAGTTWGVFSTCAADSCRAVYGGSPNNGVSYSGYFEGRVRYGTLVNGSDLTLKDWEDEASGYGLAELLQLRPIKWHWKKSIMRKEKFVERVETDEYGHEHQVLGTRLVRKFGDDPEHGFGAQHMLKTAFKGLVGTDTDEDGKTTYVVNYVGLIPPTIRAVQELAAKNQALEAKNASLEARIAKLEAAVNP